MTDEPIIAICDLHKSYGATKVLRGCSLSVDRGEVVVVCGPSGSGKSTLIKCINGLEGYQSGSIRVDGVEVGAATEASAEFGKPGVDRPAVFAGRVLGVDAGVLSAFGTASGYGVDM